LKKVLFFEGKEKQEFIANLKNQLEIKNRLLGLIITNNDRKTSSLESSKKAFKYEQQIYILQNMLNHCNSIKSRDDIRLLNKMIEQYNALE
jgi:hypothetical protein